MSIKLFRKTNPEEVVRQRVIKFLVEEKGFPKNSVCSERALSSVIGSSNRRFDILCIDHVSLQPMLLIECKRGSIDSGGLSQVLGYNVEIGALFVCVCNATEAMVFRSNGDPVNCMPSYDEVLSMVRAPYQ